MKAIETPTVMTATCGVVSMVLASALVACAGARDGHVVRHKDLVYVEGGTFLMGDVLADGHQLMLAETPVHDVEVGGFHISRYEVTVGQFHTFVRATGHRSPDETDDKAQDGQESQPDESRRALWRSAPFEQTDKDPMIWLAWEDAVAYCNWLSGQHGLPLAYDPSAGQFLDDSGTPTTDVRKVKGYRLPTEAEWEYAARERGKPVRFGNGRNTAKAAEINFDAAKPASKYSQQGPSLGRTTPVGSFAPNALGLYDMSGNVWEWCSDTGRDYEDTRLVNPCTLQDPDAWHVVRGGTYTSDAKECRVAARIKWWPGARCEATGFRIALTAD